MIAASLALLMSVNVGGSAPAMQVAVVAPATVSDALVSRICDEAATIWRSAGISFEWHRVDSEDEADAWPLEVTVDDRRASGEGGPVLGWMTFTAGRPDRSIHLSRATAEHIMQITPGLNFTTIYSRDSLIARALGRALAHELGHYLLQSKTHTSRGLMRGVWGSVDWFLDGRQGLTLTEEQCASAFQVAWQQSAPAVHWGDGDEQAGRER